MHKTAMNLVKKHRLNALSDTLVDVLLVQITNSGFQRTAAHYEKKAEKEESNKKIYTQLARLTGLLEGHTGPSGP